MSSHALHTNAAVVTRPPRALPHAVIWTPLYSESMVLIVPRRPHFVLPAEPLSALTTAPFIRFDRDTWTGLLVRDVLAAVGVRVREEMELNSVEAIVALVRQGFGVAIVPKLANVDWVNDRALRVVKLPVTVQRDVGMLERARHPRVRFTAAIKRYFDSHEGPRGKRAIEGVARRSARAR